MQIPYLTSPMTNGDKKHLTDVLEPWHKYTRRDRKNQLAFVKRTIAGNKGEMTDDTCRDHMALCKMLVKS